ncbi:MAG: hypothetical protein EOO59_18095, partial [Hymenobacter sp.]
MKSTLRPWCWLWLALLLGGLASCHHADDAAPQPVELSGQDLFVSATTVGTVAKTQLQGLATL